jgi:Peptidase family M28
MKLGTMMVFTVLIVASHAFFSRAWAGDASDGQRWWSHVTVLADDKLEGRNTGSAGHLKAAEYVAGEFARSGLTPAGTDGYLQPVHLISRAIDESHSSLSLIKPDGVEPLTLGRDAVISLRIDPAATVEAEMVFAGHGLSIPEANHDDFAGLAVRGKLVVFLAGAPPSIPGPLAAHMQSAGERAALLKRHGAIGVVNILNPKNMDIPWERLALARFQPSMILADPAMDESRGLKLAVTVNPAHADKLLAGSGHTFAEILELADAGKPLPRFAIPAKLKATASVTRADVVSQNVVAMLPGNDPRLKDEFVVFSAHLDHLGIGKPINGDSIFNGAMDNASGVAALLDVAAMLKEGTTRLRRSVLFVAVTGEEKGLLGSRFFANAPTVDSKMIVANINTDMFLPLFPLKSLTIYGLDESELGGDAVAVAESLGVAPQADLEPKRNIFIRSDQYSFIRRGIPALALKVGYDKGSPEEGVVKKWLTERYHAPSDDLNQPVDKLAAGEFDVLVARLVERVANRDSRPRWKDTSFFKRFAE